MDFDDLLQRTVELFREQADVLAQWRRRFGHVLVDEYQDTNKVQNSLVIQLAGESRQVTAVGDSDQSIYAFRGADMRNLLEFEAAFPDVRIVVLDQNYRSTQTILDAANAVISNNASRKPKDLWTDLGSGSSITVYQADDEHDEARFIVDDMIAAPQQRAGRLGRCRRVLPHQRAVAGVGRAPGQNSDPVHHGRRYPILRPS